MVTLRDNLTLDTGTARICADGSLVAEVRAARVGIQEYSGREVDPEGARFAADATVKVYRPEVEVFRTDSMATFAAAPFTIDHPAQPVDASNWRSLGKGEVNGDVVRDGQFVRVPVIVRDASAVDAVRTTHRQLSMGYACDLDFTPGTFDGQAYDAVQRNIKINHIAAVRAARGGPELKISDERPAPKEPTPMKTITVDGLPVNLGDAAAVEALVSKLNGQIADGKTALAASDAKVAAKDAEIAALTTKLADAEAKASPAALESLVAERTAVADKAKVLVPAITVDGKSAADIRKAVVDAKLGDKAKDYTPEQVAVAFDVLTVDTKADPIRATVATGVVSIGDAAAKQEAALTAANDFNSWRTAKAS